jgi:hypothetical protein
MQLGLFEITPQFDVAVHCLSHPLSARHQQRPAGAGAGADLAGKEQTAAQGSGSLDPKGHGFSEGLFWQARTIIAEAPDLVEEVRDGQMPFEPAYQCPPVSVKRYLAIAAP